MCATGNGHPPDNYEVAIADDLFVKFNRDDGYEDLDGNIDMDITDMANMASLGGNVQEGGDGGNKQKEPPEETFTIQQAIDNIGFGKFQVKLSVLTGFAWMADAMEMMILAILSPALHCEWQLQGWQEALITTVVFAGMMASSSIWGSMCDKYGRKTELILCSVFTCYFGILSAFAPTYIWLLILRGLVGFGIGGAPQSVTLYAEFLPSKSRATCVILVEIFWALGACFEVVLALIVMPTLGWKWLLGLSAIPLLIFSICCAWLPESARYDVTRGQTEKAFATIQRIAKDNGKPMPLGRLLEPHAQSSKPIRRGRISDLFTPEYRITTGLLWVIWLVCAFSYYGIVLLTTALFESPDGCHGTDVMYNPNPACFLECKTLTTADYRDLVWTTFAEFPGLFVTVFFIEKIGRKYTMAVEFSIFTVFVFLVNICTTRALLTVFLFVSRAFIAGAFQAAYVYTPEVYPTSMRAVGIGSCSGMARVGAIVTPFIAQVLLKHSAYATISIYGGMCLLATIASILLPIETKGREMTDVSSEVSAPK
ncbi:synaptic vesicle 2-related protein-like [Haliotis rufescens]|uniref:synaptic vesicle 2-related protein-like n=1 Tax=Haliotis rufescens TaxID=6454 RepID=UPI00201FB353|nr:synaptic vesicle 2-related protein-like [Haliotis rufescens]